MPPMKLHFLFLICLIYVHSAWSQSHDHSGDVRLDYSTGLEGAKEYKSLEEALKEPQKVLRLNINIGSADKIPAELFKLNKLQELILVGNKINSLPSEISIFKELQSFTLLTDTSFHYLPKEIGDLKKIRILILRGNLKELPKEIGMLEELQKLDLEKNMLTFLPSEIGNLKNLKELILYFNKLHTLPESLGGLSNLHILKVSNNELTRLPDSIGQLSMLQHLEAGHNRIASIPVSQLCKLKYFESLWIMRGNNSIPQEQIKSLSQCLPKLFIDNF